MKIAVDGQELFELTETQCRVIKNDIHDDVFYEDMKRRLHYILTHKYEQCFLRLRQEWDPKLKQLGVAMIPLDEEAYAQLVFAQPSYKSRSQREDVPKE